MPTYPAVLEYYRGDSIPFRVTVLTESDRLPYDLTGLLDAWFTVKSDPADADASAQLAYRLNAGISVASYAGGLLDIAPSATHTAAVSAATYYYDLRIKTAAGVILTIASGYFKMLDRITTAAA